MANSILYGFDQLADRFAERVSEVGVRIVDTAVRAAVAEHNRQIDALLGLFVTRTGEFKTRFRSPVAARLMGLDEHGRARPIKPAGFYDVAYPLQMAGIAWGATFIDREKMTVAEAMQATETLLMADNRWMRDHILAALYAKGGWTFSDPLQGSLAIEGLADGDAIQYLVMSGADQGATDDHYLAQAAAIADGANPFPIIRKELDEHPENGGECLVLVPSDLRPSIEALSNFLPLGDPHIRQGIAADQLVGSLGVTVPGKVIGYVDECWIAEWRSMPSSYMVALMTQGERALAMREDPEASLRGFRRVADREDYPFFESQYIRRAGFGGWNRVGAVVYRIGDAAYAVPANYDSPMA